MSLSVWEWFVCLDLWGKSALNCSTSRLISYWQWNQLMKFAFLYKLSVTPDLEPKYFLFWHKKVRSSLCWYFYGLLDISFWVHTYEVCRELSHLCVLLMSINTHVRNIWQDYVCLVLPHFIACGMEVPVYEIATRGTECGYTFYTWVDWLSTAWGNLLQYPEIPQTLLLN